jgi:hypothetical protein
MFIKSLISNFLWFLQYNVSKKWIVQNVIVLYFKLTKKEKKKSEIDILIDDINAMRDAAKKDDLLTDAKVVLQAAVDYSNFKFNSQWQTDTVYELLSSTQRGTRIRRYMEYTGDVFINVNDHHLVEVEREINVESFKKVKVTHIPPSA